MRALVLLLVLAGTASGDVRPHVEASLWPGYVWGAEVESGRSESLDDAVLDVRAALGIAWLSSSSGLAIRGGAVLDAFLQQPHGVAFGVEVQLDRDLAPWPGWRIGGRVAGMLGDGGSAASGQGQLLVPGLRLRNGNRFVGVDAILARSGDPYTHGYANGVLLGVGMSGKPGGVLVGGAAAVATILGLLIALSGGR